MNAAGYQTKTRTSSPSLSPPSDSLLDLKEYKAYPNADYIYALKKADIRFEQEDESIRAIIDYFIRIKVLDEDGVKKAALVDIPYYFDRNVEQVRNIEGITYQPDGSKDKLKSSDIRTININRRYEVKEFNMPSVKTGSVLQYRYTMVRKYIEELPDFYFAHEVPTLEAKLTLINPPYIRYKAIPLKINGKLNYRTFSRDTSSVPKIFTVPQPAPVLVETWKAQNMAPVKPKPFLPDVDTYRARIKFQISEFGIPRQPLENSWELVAAKIRRNRNPFERVENFSAADSIALAISNNLVEKKAIQDSLFRFVNNRMRHDGQTAIYSKESMTEVLSGKPVDQAAINQTLLSLLRKAGINKSWPVLVSTRGHGQINRSFPSPYQFNALMVLTVINGNKYLMDASFSHSRPGLIPIKMNNKQGMVLKESSHEWIDIDPALSYNNMRLSVEGRLQESGDLSFRLKGTTAGYPARFIRKKRDEGESPGQIVKEYFFQGFSDIRISSVEIPKWQQYQEPLKLIVNAEIKDYGQSFKSGIKYNPMLVGTLMENPFKAEERKLPIVLDAPEYLDFSYKIKTPENASVDSAHQNQTFRFKQGALSESYQLDSNLLYYKYSIRMANTHYIPEIYPKIRALYQRWVELSQQEWFIEFE